MDNKTLSPEDRFQKIEKELTMIKTNVELLLGWLPKSSVNVLMNAPLFERIKQFRSEMAPTYAATQTLKIIDLFFVTEKDHFPINLEELKNELEGKTKKRPQK